MSGFQLEKYAAPSANGGSGESTVAATADALSAALERAERAEAAARSAEAAARSAQATGEALAAVAERLEAYIEGELAVVRARAAELDFAIADLHRSKTFRIRQYLVRLFARGGTR